MPNETHPDRSELDRPNLGLLRERSQLLRELRQFFDERGFLEVQPPCLSRDCIVDAFIDPIEVSTDQLRLAMDLPRQCYLQTSPELAMKRMLASGAPSIYSLGPVFRAGEFGDNHNPEFTMLEWYDVGADLNAGIELLSALASQVFSRDACDVITYRQLFMDALGFDPIDADVETIHGRVREIDSTLAQSLRGDRDAMLDTLLTESIQPKLGRTRPMIVKNYPLSQAALARQAEDDDQCAARFELFAAGLELANGYDELRDGEVLLQRIGRNVERRIEAGRHSVGRANPRLTKAISSELPPCTGVAMGVDRLLMARTGARCLRDVIPFTIDLA